MTARKLLPLCTTHSGCGDIRISGDGVELVVEYEYRSDGKDQIGAVRFEDVVAHRFHDEMHSQGFEPASYDTVVELLGSVWLDAIDQTEPDGISGVQGKKHFALFLSNNGYLEVIARACEEMDPRDGTLA